MYSTAHPIEGRSSVPALQTPYQYLLITSIIAAIAGSLILGLAATGHFGMQGSPGCMGGVLAGCTLALPAFIGLLGIALIHCTRKQSLLKPKV